jgi:hypothetical protein
VDVGKDESSKTSATCTVSGDVDDFDDHASVRVRDVGFSLCELSAYCLLRTAHTRSLPIHNDTTVILDDLESNGGKVSPSQSFHSDSKAAN